MSKTARIFAMTSQALASAKKRPGQILLFMRNIQRWQLRCGLYLRPKPKTNELGSSGWKVLRGCMFLLSWAEIFERNRSGLKVSGS